MGAIRTVILGVWTQRNPMQESHPELDGKGQKKEKKWKTNWKTYCEPIPELSHQIIAFKELGPANVGHFRLKND